MNFLSDALNAIPVVGHIKGVVHLIGNDQKGAKKALLASTRSAAVMAGAMVGAVGGPAGAVAGAVAAGYSMDLVTSVVTEKPTGIIKGACNVCEDIENGKVPVGSIVTTAVAVGGDALTGVGMGGVAASIGGQAASIGGKTASIGGKAASKTLESVIKSIFTGEIEKVITNKVALTVLTNEAVHQVVVTQAARNIIIENVEVEGVEHRRYRSSRNANSNSSHTSNTSNKTKSSTSTSTTSTTSTRRTNTTSAESGSGSGSEPPRQNSNINNNCNLSDPYSEFLKYLNEALEKYGEDIKNKILKIFNELKERQKGYLLKQLERLMKSHCFETAIKITVDLLLKHFPEEFNFTSFLSFIEFVEVFVLNEVKVRNFQSRRVNENFSDRRIRIMNEILNDSNTVGNVHQKYLEIEKEIEQNISREPISPYFRDIFAAVYHYYKHCKLPDGKVLSVEEYFNWIRYVLRKMKQLPEYAKLLKSPNGTKLIYKIYLNEFGRRIKIVVEFYNGRIKISSAFVDNKDKDVGESVDLLPPDQKEK